MTYPVDLGWGIKKFAKRVGKGAYKYSGTKLAVKTGVATTKLATKLALLPLRYLLKAAMTIGRTLCQAPPQVLQLAAQQANVDPAFIPLFCAAVRENKFSLSSVRRLLPPALKVASKMAAAGAFPPIVPALAVVKRLPYVGRFADSGGASGGDVNVDSASVATVRKAMAAMQIVALADHLGMLDGADVDAMGLGLSERADLRAFLASQIALAGADNTDRNAMILGGVTAATAGLGFYLLFR
jgi:hypothetical protein